MGTSTGSSTSLMQLLAQLAATLVLVLALWRLCRWLADHLLGPRRVTCDAPGPPALPLVGCYFSVELPLWRWVEREGRARYGNVIKVLFPDHVAVIVSGYKEIREVFLNESLLGRPQLPWRKQVGVSSGLALSEGKLWRAHRTFSIRALNDFGWGRSAGQSDIAEESRQIVQEIRDRLGPQDAAGTGASRSAALDVGDLVTQGVSAVISRMIFGCEQVADDERFYAKLPLIQSFDRENRRSLAQTLLARLPRLLPGQGDKEPVVEALRMCQDQIDKRRRSLSAHRPGLSRQTSSSGKDYADYIEFYLREKANYFSDDESEDAPAAEAAGAAARSPGPSLRDGRLAMTIFDLMTGGIDAVANLVRWSLLLAALHPEAQGRVRAEIAQVGGDVSYADKDQLPFTEAFLEEVQRFVSLLPEGVIRRAVENTTIGGFRIPKGTRIIPNLYGVHHDPKYFPEPQLFLPDRFLKDGQFQPSRHLLPFSLGKRACPGETLARMEVFTLLAALLRSFSVALPASEVAADLLRGTDGFVRRVAEHRLLFTELPQPPQTVRPAAAAFTTGLG